MKFVPVPITGGPTAGKTVLFSIWHTRVQDYEVFATETNRAWPKPEFEQGPTHPAAMMSWEEATAFCEWLTLRERKARTIGAKDVMRLPTDHEWSCAVGIGEQEDASKLPHEKSVRIRNVYAWGTQFPPPDNTENLYSEDLAALRAAGKASGDPRSADGYRDGYAMTSPVGSYPANRFGLHDMGGNLWQYCSDWIDASQKSRVLRGRHFGDRFAPSSVRVHRPPASRISCDGFRCVLEVAPR